jgi:solute carrier family 35 (GDP-fucose transporter), member C1
VISILTVFVNKTLLSVDQLDVDAPIFIAWFQCLVSAIICFTLSRLSKIFPKVVQFPEGNPFNPLTVRNVSYYIIISYLGCNDELLKYKKHTKHFI